MNAYENGPYQQRNRSKTTLKVILVFLIVVLLGVGGLLVYMYNLSGQLQYNDVKPDPVRVIDNNVENILLVGLDVRDAGSDKGRNDLTMVLTLDRPNHKFKLCSIMRDSYVTIDGHGKNRLNTAWYFGENDGESGGARLTINTVNKLFGLDIQKYIKVDFFGLAKIIDALGGITVPEVTSGEAKEIRKYSYDNSNIKAGKNVKLTGAEAVAYGRVRHTDSDFQRTDRQREVFQLLLDKVFDMGKAELMGKMNSILPNLETNFTKEEIINKTGDILAAGFDKKIDQLRLPVKGAWENKRINKADVLSIDIDKNKDALKEFIYGS